MEHETLTQNRQIANVAIMENAPEAAPEVEEKVKPIMIYPQSAEQRRMFKEAADLDNRKLSPFIVHVLTEHIRKQRKKTA